MRIIIDKKSLISTHDQIIQQVIGATEGGDLKKGDQLQTVRSLAKELNISPNTVMRAYETLERKGYIELKMGYGTFVIWTETTEKKLEMVKAVSDLRTLVSIMRGKGWNETKIRRALEAAFRKED